MKKPLSHSYFFVHNINVLAQIGGFDLLLEVLQAPQKNNFKKPSFRIYLSILHILNSVKEYFEKQFWDEYVEKVKEAYLIYIEHHFSYDDLRNL